MEDGWCQQVKEELYLRGLSVDGIKPVVLAEGLFMYFTLEEIRTFLEVLKRNFQAGGTLIAEQNTRMMVKNEKYHDTVKKTNAQFRSGTDSGQEIADLVEGMKLLEEHSINEEMKKYSIRGKLFALLFPKLNDRWATFSWGKSC